MNITSKIAAAALAAVTLAGAVATPVLASDSQNFDSSYFLTQLRYDGVNAIDANDRGDGTVVVTVQLKDGRSVFQYFNLDTYQQIKIG